MFYQIGLRALVAKGIKLEIVENSRLVDWLDDVGIE
jgi:hypothetical protein